MTLISFAVTILIVASFLCLYRIGAGPTAADRIVAIDILGTLIVGFCAALALATNRDFYLNVAVAWALVSFIGTLALAKHLEGRQFHD